MVKPLSSPFQASCPRRTTKTVKSPLRLLPRQKLIQNPHLPLERSKPSPKLPLHPRHLSRLPRIRHSGVSLVINIDARQLIVESLPGGGRRDGGVEDRLHQEAVVLAEGFTVGGAEGGRQGLVGGRARHVRPQRRRRQV